MNSHAASSTSSPALLRALLGIDAASSLAMALLLGLGAGALAPRLGLPAALLQAAGLALLPFVGLLVWLVRRSAPPRSAVWAVVAINLVWVLESLLIGAGLWFAPTALGQGFVLAQAGAVAVLAALQASALRRGAGRGFASA